MKLIMFLIDILMTLTDTKIFIIIVAITVFAIRKSRKRKRI